MASFFLLLFITDLLLWVYSSFSLLAGQELDGNRCRWFKSLSCPMQESIFIETGLACRYRSSSRPIGQCQLGSFLLSDPSLLSSLSGFSWWPRSDHIARRWIDRRHSPPTGPFSGKSQTIQPSFFRLFSFLFLASHKTLVCPSHQSKSDWIKHYVYSAGSSGPSLQCPSSRIYLNTMYHNRTTWADVAVSFVVHVHGGYIRSNFLCRVCPAPFFWPLLYLSISGGGGFL